MKNHYHQDVIVSPQILDYTVNNQCIQIIFDQDLKERPIVLKGIDIDKKVISLQASINKNVIFIPEHKVAQIIYADDNVPQIQILNKLDLPVSPFIIDIKENIFL